MVKVNKYILVWEIKISLLLEENVYYNTNYNCLSEAIIMYTVEIVTIPTTDVFVKIQDTFQNIIYMILNTYHSMGSYFC